MEPIHRRRDFLQRAGALLLSGTLLGGCAARRPAAPGPAAPAAGGTPAAPAAPPAGQPVPALRAGARIAIVAPASAIAGAADEAAEWLLERGYEPQVMPAARMRLAPPFDYLAGDDAARLADLHAAFADPAVGAVWCLQGGFGSWRVLDQIDYGLLRRHAKPFIGYSDVTALHLAIQRYAGFVTFHGPMLAQDLLAGRQAPTEQALLDMVSGRLGAGSWIVAPPQARLATLASGVATGRLIGGNLALLAALTGTRYAIDARDGILFFEDVNEALPRVDRMLAQLRRAGAFDGVRGVLVGSFTRLLGVPGDGEAAQAALYPLVREHFQARGIPVLAGWPSGHGDPNLTLPLGARVTLDAGRGALRLEQPVVV
ncbi:LD-carboxypeptidase [Bordetella bronchiseptica MBORD675]|nr:LD-carboxypeptidase [Bordetella bronchiseptica MBORD675]